MTIRECRAHPLEAELDRTLFDAAAELGARYRTTLALSPGDKCPDAHHAFFDGRSLLFDVLKEYKDNLQAHQRAGIREIREGLADIWGAVRFEALRRHDTAADAEILFDQVNLRMLSLDEYWKVVP